MTRPLNYFDNAATTFPKPAVVYEAADQYLRQAGNPGRGAHQLAMHSAQVIFDARLTLAELLGIKQAERLVFTPGCTYSINMALKGMSFSPGDVVLTSALEHNAMTRCLHQLQQSKGIEVLAMPYARKGIVDLHSLIKALLERKPRLVAMSEGSNVTGEVLDLRSLSAICSAHKVPLLIDAAQTAGRATQRLDDYGVSIWCASGHKGLFGSPGVGLLYVSANVDLEPLVAGGTGSRSEEVNMPSFYPDRLESGTVPGPAIAALGAGAAWLQKTGIDNVRQKEMELTKRFLNWSLNMPNIRVYGNRQDDAGTAIVSFSLDGIPPDQVGSVLSERYNMAVRVGLHCAAAAHKTLGTSESGLVRASFGYFNTEQEVDALCSALEEIGKTPAN